MNETKEPNLEELLSGYLDGRLSERQLTELKRLISNDRKVAAKLKSMQRTKELLAALPKSPAPPEILQGVRQRMQRKMAMAEHPAIVTQRRAGARHLMLRRTLAAAAMIALLSVLVLLVFNILQRPPQDRPTELSWPQLVRESSPKIAVDIPKTIPPAVREGPEVDVMPVVLELRTTEPRAVNAAIARALYDSGLLECTNIENLSNQDIYSLNCDMISTAVLALDLKGLWERFQATNLSLARENFEQQVIIHNVTAEQVVTILTQRDIKNRDKLAKDFAALNTMAALMPGRGILNTIQGSEYNLLTVDKPVLTSGKDLKARAFPGTELIEEISFTIVVRATE